jgi:predicted ATP-grasp superfamily ATP-dependent carboligase
MQKMILLGASARSLAYSTSCAGLAPYAIDRFADRDLAAIGPAVKIERYPADFLAALAEAPQSDCDSDRRRSHTARVETGVQRAGR